MKTNEKITKRLVDALQPSAERIRVWDTDIKGFHVRVSPKGKKTYALAYRHNGIAKEYTIGMHGNITTEQARNEARIKTGKISEGTDVQQAKKSDKVQAMRAQHETFCIFIAQRYKPWAESNLKGSKETLRTLNVDFALWHSRKLSAISQWDVQKWMIEKRKSGLAVSTINRRVATLKAVLSKAVEWEVIEASPLAGMKRLKTNRTGRVRFLDQNEERALRSALEARQVQQRRERESYNRWLAQRKRNTLPSLGDKFTDYLMPLVLLAINTGMRRGELFNLRWTDSDLNGRVVTIQGDGAKSGDTRHIPINGEAFATLVAWRNQTKNNELVFPSPVTGDRLDNIYTSWGKLMDNAKLINFRFHDLRHHFASSLVMRGVDLNTVRELLGHADIAMTLRYAHLAPEHKASAVALLDQPLSNIPTLGLAGTHSS